MVTWTFSCHFIAQLLNSRFDCQWLAKGYGMILMSCTWCLDIGFKKASAKWAFQSTCHENLSAWQRSSPCCSLYHCISPRREHQHHAVACALPWPESHRAPVGWAWETRSWQGQDTGRAASDIEDWVGQNPAAIHPKTGRQYAPTMHCLYPKQWWPHTLLKGDWHCTLCCSVL